MTHGADTQEKQGEKWTACVLDRTGFERNGESKDGTHRLHIALYLTSEAPCQKHEDLQ